MRKLIATVALTGGLIGAGVALPMIAMAQPAAAAEGSGGATHTTILGYNLTEHTGGLSGDSALGAAIGGNGLVGANGGAGVVTPSGTHCSPTLLGSLICSQLP